MRFISLMAARALGGLVAVDDPAWGGGGGWKNQLTKMVKRLPRLLALFTMEWYDAASGF